MCVPHKQAQEVANLMVDAGITEIWNWSGIPVHVQKDIAVYQEPMFGEQSAEAFFKLK